VSGRNASEDEAWWGKLKRGKWAEVAGRKS